MCGIFGAVHLTGAFGPRDYATFVGLTGMVTYRGPNASGHLAVLLQETVEQNRERFNVFLGHRRLSILDTSDAANQPFTGDGRTWIAFNGEIFNFIELRTELERKGHFFSTRSDTEVLLKIYTVYGAEAFHMLNGMWAFAILDTKRRTVVLSRDRFSIKPLYVLQSAGALYFASEIKQLRPLTPTTRLNERVMSTFLNQGLSDCSDETFFEGIRQLKPKHNLVIDLQTGAIREQQYWEHTPHEEVGRLKPEDAIARFRELFTDSVRIRLRSDVEIGVAISGGLDSSAIAVISDRLQPGFQTYSAVSKDSRFSEEPYIDLLCREKKLRNKKVILESAGAVDLVPEVTDHHDEPLGGFSIVAHYQLMQAIKQQTGVVVVLSGQGGDEILMGYLRFFFFMIQEMLRRGRVIRAVSEMVWSLMNGTCVRQFNYAKSRRYRRSSSKGHDSFVRLPYRPEPYGGAAI